MLTFSGFLPDRRLARRADDLAAAIRMHQSVSMGRIANGWAEQVGFYRLLANDRLESSELIEALTASCAGRVKGNHMLVLQDTTEFNFQRHAGRIQADSGLGVIGDNESMGFFLHPNLVIDADTTHALGFSDVRLFKREPNQPDKHARAYKRLPIEQKESYRWIESAQASRRCLGDAPQVTFVADREGDIYTLFERLPDARTHTLVRSRSDRRIIEAPGSLYAYLAQQEVAGSQEIQLRGDLRRGRQGRRARLRYRFARLHLVRPATCLDREASESVRLYAVEVAEHADTVPAGEQAVCWRLLTTHPVETFAQACQVARWYRQRWYIEQLFRLLKAEGIDLESSQLETGTALMRLCTIALGASLDVLRLMLAERGESDQSLEAVFSGVQQQCLHVLSPQVEGRTAKQQNPHRVSTLAWAAWIIARLGGWNGYRSQRSAGPTTYQAGLKQFTMICEGWHLAHPDVYKP